MLPKAKLLELATCGFIEKRENVLLIGRAGIGKSHCSLSRPPGISRPDIRQAASSRRPTALLRLTRG
ncbi:MAG: ATP-binding protein [Planctomycetes bacterium]|nr:ATP-binding protein [Planctomycetota bacterium]